jgi:low temperature requirement protein LtrA
LKNEVERLTAASNALARAHHLIRMTGRDTEEQHRVATPLELLFDLTFVVALSFAGNELAHSVSAGHLGVGLTGFGFAMFAVCWTWINFTWFASAFDTDDWVFRLATMVQMLGVLILALGIGPMFASLDHGEHVDNSVIVLGHVVMRVAMVSSGCVPPARARPTGRPA